ncbi:MAG TPA: S8 family serine peptidase [Solirubrobacteraceae bacterium]|jgi:serine protease|nr:S8 family serine peptidase [Solirubrobacteraceae bacterium]
MHPLARLLPPLAAAATLLAAPALASATSGVAAAPEREGYVPGEVVVRLRASADEGDVKKVQRQAGVGRARTFAPHTRVVKIRDGESVADTVRELREHPEVATAVPNRIAHLARFVPNDRGNSGAAQGWQALQWNFLPGAGVNAPDAWQHLLDAGRPGGRGAVVAVLDTGVAYANKGRRFRRSPDFWHGDFVRGYDFVDRDADPSDENGHGTHVASTIGERTNNDLGVTGLAYGARIMPVRVLDEDGAGDGVDITGGIRYAVRHGADVINLSFEFDDGLRQVRASEIPDVLAALRYAYRHRVLVVAAAGNQARRALAYPARSPYTMAVGATTEHACLADYSNIGRGLDIVAPGGGSDDTNDPACPVGAPGGRDIFQMTFPWASGYDSPRASSSFRRFGLPSGFVGTSMASPHVAATAALVVASRVIGRYPSPSKLMLRLQATATDAGVPGFDRRYGAGRLNAAAATDPAI